MFKVDSKYTGFLFSDPNVHFQHAVGFWLCRKKTYSNIQMYSDIQIIEACRKWIMPSGPSHSV